MACLDALIPRDLSPLLLRLNQLLVRHLAATARHSHLTLLQLELPLLLRKDAAAHVIAKYLLLTRALLDERQLTHLATHLILLLW